MSTQKISRFMVIESKETQALFFKVMLMNRQYQSITIAKSGAEALELIEVKRIQCVITAWDLPDMSGPAFVQRVRTKQQYAHIPFVIYSDRMSPEEWKLTQELGFKNAIRLPMKEEDAFQVIKSVVELEENLDPIEITMRNAEILYAEKQYSQAINELKPALVKGHFFHRTQTLLGSIYFAQSQLEDAESAVNGALDHDDNYAGAIHLIAKIYAKTGRHEKAISKLQKVSLESPMNIQHLISLGSAFMDADRDDDAEKAFEQAAKIDANHPGLKDEKGKLAFKKGDYHMARELLADTSNVDEIVRHLNNVAIGIAAKKDFAHAIKVYEAALGILKNQSQNHIIEYNMGLAYKKGGDLPQAFEIFARIYRRVPAYTKAYASFVHTVKAMESSKIFYNRQTAEQMRTLHQVTINQKAG